MNYTPILVFVHTRHDHFKRCIDSLLKCPESKNTDLYISSDFQRNENEKKSVELIREYINGIKGFKKVHPIFFDKNVGMAFASHYSVNKVFEENDSIIMLEDDNVVSPLFLEFLNTGLGTCKNDPKIFSICGFSPQIFSKNYDSKRSSFFYKSIRWAPWGFGITKNNYNKYIDFRNSESTLSNLKIDLKNKFFCTKLKSMGLDLYNHLLYCSRNNVMFEFDHGVAYYCLKNSQRSLYSYHSLTKNTGNDGSGQRSLSSRKISNYFNFEFQKVNFDFQDFMSVEHIDDLWFPVHNNLKEKIKTASIKMSLFKKLKKIHRIIVKSNLFK